MWKAVVPSYKRPDGFVRGTLAMLEFHGVPASRIYLFVADEREKSLYAAAVGRRVGHIVVAVKGLVPVRNFIFGHFAKGTRLVSFDDDVKGLVSLDSKGGLRPLKAGELQTVIERGFRECKAAGARLWGVYPTPNAFYMKPTVSTDLKFIIGNFWGCINPGGEVRIDAGFGCKDDYARSILFWQRDGAVVRLNFLAAKAALYTNPGGLQAAGPRARLADARRAVALLLKRWPQYVRLNPRRAGPFPEILLRKPAGKKAS